jgi:hypothetical protein
MDLEAYFYGFDLPDYLREEFGVPNPYPAPEPLTIPFWTDFVVNPREMRHGRRFWPGYSDQQCIRYQNTSLGGDVAKIGWTFFLEVRSEQDIPLLIDRAAQVIRSPLTITDSEPYFGNPQLYRVYAHSSHAVADIKEATFEVLRLIQTLGYDWDISGPHLMSDDQWMFSGGSSACSIDRMHTITFYIANY